MQSIGNIFTAQRCITGGYILTLGALLVPIVRSQLSKLQGLKSECRPYGSLSALMLSSVLITGGLAYRLHPVVGMAVVGVYGIPMVVGAFCLFFGPRDKKATTMIAMGVTASAVSIFATGSDLSFRLGRLFYRLPDRIGSWAVRGPLCWWFDTKIQRAAGLTGSMSYGVTGLGLGLEIAGVTAFLWKQAIKNNH